MNKKEKASRKKRRSQNHRPQTARSLWKGSISFGLVNVPVVLVSAQQAEKIHFRLLDKRDHSPVGYKNINKRTGDDIRRENIVKAFELEKNEYVIMSDADFKKANVKATSTIDIEDFVFLDEVDPLLFERPYYILPQKGGEKGYVLLREVLSRTKKAAIAKIVLHTVQRLAAILVKGDYLILEILRFADEIKEVDEVDFLDPSVNNARVSEREINVATQLVDGMSNDWSPKKYRNTYREDLMKLIKAKSKRGGAVAVAEVPTDSADESSSNVVDLTALLKKSLDVTKKPKSKRSNQQRAAEG